MSPESRVIRFWAALDLIVTLPLAVPFAARGLLAILTRLNEALGLPGAAAILPAVGMLFACLTGALGVTWALARLRHPQPRLGRLDAWARLWVGAVILGAVFDGLPAVFAVFVVSEWLGAASQLWSLRRGEEGRPAGGKVRA